MRHDLNAEAQRTAEIAEVPAWVEELAKEWEARAASLSIAGKKYPNSISEAIGRADALRVAAADLRAAGSRSVKSNNSPEGAEQPQG